MHITGGRQGVVASEETQATLHHSDADACHRVDRRRGRKRRARMNENLDLGLITSAAVTGRQSPVSVARVA
jgi:hypothetical protein